jgi:predicted transcriptional regulator
VRDVFDALGGEGAYTTVLKLLQIMTDKRLVRRDESARTHIYEAAYSEDQTQKQIVSDLLDRVFDGSAAKLVLHALEAGTASREEIAEIRKLLDKHRKERR